MTAMLSITQQEESAVTFNRKAVDTDTVEGALLSASAFPFHLFSSAQFSLN